MNNYMDEPVTKNKTKVLGPLYSVGRNKGIEVLSTVILCWLL